jgi:hypothetical protein
LYGLTNTAWDSHNERTIIIIRSSHSSSLSQLQPDEVQEQKEDLEVVHGGRLSLSSHFDSAAHFRTLVSNWLTMTSAWCHSLTDWKRRRRKSSPFTRGGETWRPLQDQQWDHANTVVQNCARTKKCRRIFFSVYTKITTQISRDQLHFPMKNACIVHFLLVATSWRALEARGGEDQQGGACCGDGECAKLPFLVV